MNQLDIQKKIHENWLTVSPPPTYSAELAHLTSSSSFVSIISSTSAPKRCSETKDLLNSPVAFMNVSNLTCGTTTLWATTYDFSLCPLKGNGLHSAQLLSDFPCNTFEACPREPFGYKTHCEYTADMSLRKGRRQRSDVQIGKNSIQNLPGTEETAETWKARSTRRISESSFPSTW